MASNSDRVDSALKKLEYQLQYENMREVILHPVNFPKNSFEGKFRLVRMFVDCVHKWSDADKVVPDLGSLLIKFEAAMEEIGSQLESIPPHVDYSDKSSIFKSLFPKVRRKTELKYLQKWALQVTDVFNNLNKMIEHLVQEIRQFHDSHSLPSRSLQCRSPMGDFDGWKNFLLSIERNLNFLLGSDCFRNVSLSEKFRAFTLKIPVVTNFLDLVAESSPQNHETEELMIRVASVAVRAALLSFAYWITKRDSNMDNVGITTLANLPWDIDLTTPEYLDLNLRVLAKFQSVTVDQVKAFVDCFLIQAKPDAHYTELTTLITSVINILQNNYNNEDALRFLADVKALIMEVGSLQHILLGGNDRIELNLLTKIWHIKIEIFLWVQLNTVDISHLSAENQICELRTWVECLDFKKALKYQRTVSTYPPVKKTENAKEILKIMTEVVTEIVSLRYSSYVDKIKVRNLQFKLLLKIAIFKIKSLLMELSNESLMGPIEDQIKPLHEELKFLLILFVKSQKVGVVEHELIFTHFQPMASGLIPLFHSSRANKTTQELVKNVNLLLPQMLDQNKLVMAKLKEKYVHFSGANFPKTNCLGFIGSFLRRLRGLLHEKADLFACVKDSMQELLANLEFLRPILRDILAQDIAVQELKDILSRVVDVAYEAEYLIDLIVLKNVVEWYHSVCLYQLLKDIRLVKLQATRIFEKKSNDVRVHDVTQTSRTMISNATTQTINNFLADLNDEEEVIIDLLMGGFLQRDVVSIVGMPGLGKTTIAKKVYDSPKVQYHFHIRAWCCVSQTYHKRELLLGILSHITSLTDNILGMTDEDLDFKLYQLLKPKKYLIVMDDMWNTGAWDDLEKSFPNDENGSRILITSRLHDVLQGKAHTHVHALRPLSDDESWNLLEKKIFHEEVCPEELMEVGKQIAKSCKGLPLSIVAMAGLLGRTEQKEELWNRISESLSLWFLDDRETRCMGILELSYKHLPENLKACFLYFGTFLEDEDIPVQKLVRIWIAEGFVEKIAVKSLEDLAEDYLMDLIGRSLVIVAQWRSKGGVKACRVHDMLRNLCLSKAKEENFLKLVTRLDEDCASFDGLDYGVDSEDTYSSNPVTYEDHRLCIHSKRKHFVMSRPSGPPARSLLFFASSDMYPRCPYDISFIFHNFKILKVLDLECINMGTSFHDAIESLIYLRYLAVSGDIDFVPSSISHLLNLETFILKGLKGKVKLPNTFWFMETLRHVRVSNSVVFSFIDGKVRNSCQLHDLVSLSSPILSYGESSNEILMQFPNLQKLKCILLESHDGSGDCSLFPRVDVLTQLKSLKISYHGRVLYSGELVFPLNLTKLTLSNFRMPWDHISAVGRLPNLEVLKLLSRAFEGESWNMIEGEFLKLKFLKLDTLDIAKWNASSDHLPYLQQLVLRSCKHLEEVPYSFGEIPSLQVIEVQWCGNSAEESARKIREDAVEGLKVFIHSDSDFRPSS